MPPSLQHVFALYTQDLGTHHSSLDRRFQFRLTTVGRPSLSAAPINYRGHCLSSQLSRVSWTPSKLSISLSFSRISVLPLPLGFIPNTQSTTTTIFDHPSTSDHCCWNLHDPNILVVPIDHGGARSRAR
ncbi:hypothetical protein M0R45_012043 [Rubus argutus]|uniref:Uncharacterized protein n=1 Tax=Rubus argutus TaxID=59490 RepID=A0AAW1YER2_RUBAR